MHCGRRSFPTPVGWFFARTKPSSSTPSAARAGTHNQRPWLWLWVPAFAGTTQVGFVGDRIRSPHDVKEPAGGWAEREQNPSDPARFGAALEDDLDASMAN